MMRDDFGKRLADATSTNTYDPANLRSAAWSLNVWILDGEWTLNSQDEASWSSQGWCDPAAPGREDGVRRLKSCSRKGMHPSGHAGHQGGQ